jgi:hypothetical protein
VRGERTREEGRGKREEGRGKREEEGRGKRINLTLIGNPHQTTTQRIKQGDPFKQRHVHGGNRIILIQPEGGHRNRSRVQDVVQNEATGLSHGSG